MSVLGFRIVSIMSGGISSCVFAGLSFYYLPTWLSPKRHLQVLPDCRKDLLCHRPRKDPKLCLALPKFHRTQQ